MNKFRNRKFNRLYEFMKEMDSSDDYLMIQVSSLDLGNNEVEMCLIATGMKEGDSSIHEDDFVELLTEVMKKSAAFKRLITKAARKCAQLDNCPWMMTRNPRPEDGLTCRDCAHQEHSMFLNHDRCGHFKKKEQ